MQLEINIRNLSKISLNIILASLFYLSPRFIGVFSFLLIPIALSIILITGYRYEVSNTLLSLLIINSLIIFLSYSEAISFFINLTIPSIIFLYFFKSDNNISMNKLKKIILYLIVYAILINIIIIILVHIKYFNQIAEKIVSNINKIFNSYINILKEKKVPQVEIDKLNDYRVMTIKILLSYYPSLIFINMLSYFGLNILLSFSIISKYILKKPKFIYILFLKVRDSFIWPFLISWSLVFLSFFIHTKLFSDIVWNIAISISFIYVLQGSIILLHKLLFLKISNFLKFIILFITIEMIFNFFIVGIFVLLGIGLFDTWFDFRKISTLDDIEKLI